MISVLVPGSCNVVYDTLASQPRPAVAREESQGCLVLLRSGLLLGLRLWLPWAVEGRCSLLQGKLGRASSGQLWSHAGCLMRLQGIREPGNFLMCTATCLPES